jgi:hypothetical protein
MWGSPLKPKVTKSAVLSNQSVPTNRGEKKLELFKPIPLTLTKGEAKKVLDSKKPLSHRDVEWVQRYLETVIRERSLPPQLAGDDAYGQIMTYLSPKDALLLLEGVRSSYRLVLPPEEEEDEFAYLRGTDLGAFHEHLPPPLGASHNSQKQDGDL